MHYIEHIIEPKKLLLIWQSRLIAHRTRYIVGELEATNGQFTLKYLVGTPDFEEAKKWGFESYPAFPHLDKVYDNVLDAFMRRVPPRTRGDFPQYLQSLRLRPDAQFSDFALLGYSGAKLPSDGFSLFHPFSNVHTACELLVEAAGYRHLYSDFEGVSLNDAVTFELHSDNGQEEGRIEILVNGKQIGYVTRGLLPAFSDWITKQRIGDAWVEKLNGTPDSPNVYIYVKVLPDKD
jgi:hypothetical protein